MGAAGQTGCAGLPVLVCVHQRLGCFSGPVSRACPLKLSTQTLFSLGCFSVCPVCVVITHAVWCVPSVIKCVWCVPSVNTCVVCVSAVITHVVWCVPSVNMCVVCAVCECVCGVCVPTVITCVLFVCPL